jgi:hypothetical protein
VTEREPQLEALSGRFWLADAAEQKVSGRLTLGSEGPRLELDGTLTPGMRLRSVATAEDGSSLNTYVPVLEEDELLTVHGEIDSAVGIEPVTLVDGITTSRTFNLLSPGAGRQRLQGLYACRGGHVAGNDELFTQVRVRLHHLDEWASLGGFGQEFDQDKASIIFEQPKVLPVPLHNGGRLDLQQVLACFSDVLGRGLTRTVWLRVVNLPPTRWRELDRGLVTPLSTLLTLAVDADCPPVQVEVATGPDSGWLSIHSSGLRPPPDGPLPAGQMLLPLAVLGLPGVAAWLDRVETLGPLPPVVAAAVAGPPRTVETGVLDLTTVAEGLARRLWPDWNRLTKEQAVAARKTALAAVEKQGDEVVKVVQGALDHLIEPSYPQRLLRLAERADSVVPKVLGRRTDGRPSRWKGAVAGARNDFAHSQDRGWLGEERLDQYLAVIGSLRWLLTAVLLLETGLPAETLAARFAQHQRYLLFLRQAREWHPDVYV